jgi:hypothetical protein
LGRNQDYHMPITFPSPPLLNQQALALRIAQIAESPLSGSKGQLAGVAIDALSYTTPHQNWYSSVDALMSGRLLADAQPRSWRYLLCEGDRGVGEFETEESDQQSAKPFIAVHEGAAAQLTIDALQFAESVTDVQIHDFEMRFLKIPARNFTALWLHRSNQDIIIPVTGHYDVLLSNHAYTEAEITNALRARMHEGSYAPGRQH